jgi:uncharacterized membrane protein YgaE (UPF0421/DUF939 family)
MIKESKVSKYLLYAIGEIILVVIGILIALQINNWNKSNQSRKVELAYLKEISKNLKSDLGDIRFNIDFNETRYHSSEVVLNALERDESYNDTLDFYFGSLLYTTRTVVDYSAFDALKSQGIELISNDSLRQMISKLYSFHYHNVIDFEIQDDHNLQYTIVMPTVLSRLTIRQSTEEHHDISQQLARPIDFNALKEDDDFKNALTMNKDLRKYMLINYRGLERRVKEVQEGIRIELENLEN